MRSNSKRTAYEEQTKMANLDKGKSVTLEELLVSTLTQGDAFAKLLI